MTDVTTLSDADSGDLAGGYLYLWVPGTPPTQRKVAIADFLELGLEAASAAEIRGGTVADKAATPKSLSDAAVPQVLTDGATINWNINNGYNAEVTLGGDRTLAAPTNPKKGWTYTLAVIQDATGSRGLTWPAAFDWGAAGEPVLTEDATKHDLITLFCTDAATPTFNAFLSGGGFA